MRGPFARLLCEMLLQGQPFAALFHLVAPRAKVHERFEVGQTGEDLVNLPREKYPDENHHHCARRRVGDIHIAPVTTEIVVEKREQLCGPEHDHDGEETQPVPEQRAVCGHAHARRWRLLDLEIFQRLLHGLNQIRTTALPKTFRSRNKA